MQLSWKVVLCAALMVVVLVVGAGTGTFSEAVDVVAAFATVAVALYGIGTWKLYQLERQDRAGRVARLFSRVLLLSGYIDLYVQLLENEIHREEDRGLALLGLLLPDVDDLCNELRELYDDAIATNQEALESIAAAEIMASEVAIRIRSGAADRESLKSIVEDLTEVKRGLFRAASDLPRPTDAPIGDLDGHYIRLRSRVREMTEGEDQK